MLELSALSIEYVKVPVAAVVNGVVINPTSDVVKLAFMVSGSPAPSDWLSGSWETIDGQYYARCLVGPGTSKVLAVGQYVVWVQVSDNPETPVKRAGAIRVI